MRHVPAVPSRAFRRRAGAVASLSLVAVLALLAGCGSSSTASSAQDNLLSPTTTADPGPGPTSFDADLELTMVVSGLDDPIAVVARPMRNQLWIAERRGRVRVVTRNTTWNQATGKAERTGYTLESDPVLDITALTTTDGTRGLLSLAFSTDGSTLYIHQSGLDGELIIARYTVTDPLDYSGAPPRTSDTTSTSSGASTTTPMTTMPGPIGRPAIDPASRVELLNVEHERALQHYGGQLALGPDGYLYISTGGTGRGIPLGASQDPYSLHGKILRIDPTVAGDGRTYSIPSDNPFADGGGAPEIWAMGLRNPWRFSFDRTTGDMWIGDVGKDEVEEIDRITHDSAPGVNLGFPVREGDQPYQEGIDGGVTAFSALTEPVLVYPHTEERCAVIGGFMYRGTAVNGLDGVYLYADYCTGAIRGLLSRNSVILEDKRLSISVEPSTINGFGEDDQGELYVLTTAGTLSLITNAR